MKEKARKAATSKKPAKVKVNAKGKGAAKKSAAVKSAPLKRKIALIAGASGLTGGHLLGFLLESRYYAEVHALVRRPLGITHPRYREHVVDFDRPETYRKFAKVDDVFCTLGTTIKKAGSQEEFYKVDFIYAITVAREAALKGAARLFIVTALGANAKSRIFYNRVKGEVEEASRLLPFKSIHVFRPSLLLGERGEVRTAEKIGSALARALTPLMAGPLRAWRAVEAQAVAWAMLHAAVSVSVSDHPGGVIESREIQEVWEGREGGEGYGLIPPRYDYERDLLIVPYGE